MTKPIPTWRETHADDLGPDGGICDSQICLKWVELEIDALRTRLAEVEKDALRYQLVKTMSRAMSLDICGLHYWHIQLRGNVRGPNLDAAIDAAMKEQA